MIVNKIFVGCINTEKLIIKLKSFIIKRINNRLQRFAFVKVNPPEEKATWVELIKNSSIIYFLDEFN